MRVLVIDAHPLADSLAVALHRAVIETLRRGGHQVDDCDLYAEGFEPVLSPPSGAPTTPQAPISAASPSRSRGRGAGAVFPDLVVRDAGDPQGIFDRVWAQTVAFHLPEGGGAIRPGIDGHARNGKGYFGRVISPSD
jgi:putative NADPH-quinone reductase